MAAPAQPRALWSRLDAYLSRGPLEIAGWDVARSGALRKGCWKGVETIEDALAQSNIELARMAGLVEDDVILDAGCGLGSTCLFLSDEIGCRTVGITLHEGECRQANETAAVRGLDGLALFEVMDFTDTTFPDQNFDAVFAIESMTWLDNKEDLLREAWRVLKPGGQLIVSDQFLGPNYGGWIARRVCRIWTRGYGNFKLSSLKDWRAAATRVGFEETAFEDWTDWVLPSSRRLAKYAFIWGFPDLVLAKVFRYRGARRRRAFFSSSRAEYIAFRLRYGAYFTTLLRKPTGEN